MLVGMYEHFKKIHLIISICRVILPVLVGVLKWLDHVKTMRVRKTICTRKIHHMHLLHN